MELKDLIGRHVLTHAACLEKKLVSSWKDEEADVMTIGIDNKTYVLIEDPSDGYRSYLESIQEIPVYIGAGAPINREVVILQDRNEEALLNIFDLENGHLWAVS